MALCLVVRGKTKTASLAVGISRQKTIRSLLSRLPVEFCCNPSLYIHSTFQNWKNISQKLFLQVLHFRTFTPCFGRLFDKHSRNNVCLNPPTMHIRRFNSSRLKLLFHTLNIYKLIVYFINNMCLIFPDLNLFYLVTLPIFVDKSNQSYLKPQSNRAVTFSQSKSVE